MNSGELCNCHCFKVRLRIQLERVYSLSSSVTIETISKELDESSLFFVFFSVTIEAISKELTASSLSRSLTCSKSS